MSERVTMRHPSITSTIDVRAGAVAMYERSGWEVAGGEPSPAGQADTGDQGAAGGDTGGQGGDPAALFEHVTGDAVTPDEQMTLAAVVTSKGRPLYTFDGPEGTEPSPGHFRIYTGATRPAE